MLYSYLLGILLVIPVSGRTETGDHDEGGTAKIQPVETEGPRIRSASDEMDDSWWKLQISPQAIVSMPFLNFRINIYKDSGKLQASQGRTKYYYAPLSVLDSQSAVSRQNNVTNEFEMRFKVYLRSDKVEQDIATYLSSFLKTKIETQQLQVIPFERVILASAYTSDNYRISSEWIPYQFHTFLWFRIVCLNLETCDHLAEQMRSNPEQFSHLKLQFSLESQQSRRRKTIIKVENIQSGALFSELNQRFPQSDEVLLTAADAKRLVSESVTNVILETFSDKQIVAQEDQSPIYNILEKLMIAGREAISSDSGERWNSVFWNEDNNRPDRITKTFNEVYRNSVEEAQEKLRDVVSLSQKTSTEIGAEFEGFGFNHGFTRETSDSDENEKEKFLKTIAEAIDTVQWEGEKFSPKPMTLSRVNLADIRNSQTFHDLTTQVTYTKAVLSTAINTPSNTISSEVEAMWKGVKAMLENTQAELEKVQAALDSQAASVKTELNSFDKSASSLVGVSALMKKTKMDPVFFSAYRKSIYPNTNTTLTYDGGWLNYRGAMNGKTGVFKAPYHGIYFFSFHGHFSAQNEWNSVLLKVDGQTRAAAGHNDNTRQLGASDRCDTLSQIGATVGLSQILELTRESRVSIWYGAANTSKELNPRFQYDGPYYGTQFNGILLHTLE